MFQEIVIEYMSIVQYLSAYFSYLCTKISYMDSKTFQKLLTEEAQSFKSYLETDSHDWIVKGFIIV